MRKTSLSIIILQSLLLSSPSVNSFVPLRLPRRYQPARTTRRREGARQGGIYKGITGSTVSHIRCAGTGLTPKGKPDFDATFVGSSGTRGTVLGVLVTVSVAAGGSFLAVASLFRIFEYGRARGSVAPQPSPRRTPPATPSTTFVRRATNMLGAWRCSGSTNSELIKNLVDANLIRSPRVAKAMQATDRGFYTPHDAYEDRPQPIGFRATISAPHMHAHALEVLSPAIPAEGGRVLDVGCGSGYLTGALARLVGETGFVYGMDYIPNLVGMTKTNLEKDDESLLASGRVSLLTGDGWKGWAEKGPYDAIHVGAAAETIPEDLVSQLKVGGRMVVPVGPQSSSQMLVQVDRIKDTGPISESYTTEGLMAVVYVPLVST